MTIQQYEEAMSALKNGIEADRKKVSQEEPGKETESE